MSYNKRILDYLREKKAINTDKVGSLKGVKVGFHAVHFYSSVALAANSFLLSDNSWFKQQVQLKMQQLK